MVVYINVNIFPCSAILSTFDIHISKKMLKAQYIAGKSCINYFRAGRRVVQGKASGVWSVHFSKAKCSAVAALGRVKAES